MIAAGEAVLRSGGYVVTRRRETGSSGEIAGKSHEQGLTRYVPGRGVTISARASGAETAIVIRVGPLGDEQESRALLDRLLATLGR